MTSGGRSSKITKKLEVNNPAAVIFTSTSGGKNDQMMVYV